MPCGFWEEIPVAVLVLVLELLLSPPHLLGRARLFARDMVRDHRVVHQWLESRPSFCGRESLVICGESGEGVEPLLLSWPC